MVLLTGGSGSESEILSSTELLNIDGSVETCDAPDLPEPRKNHVTFVTKTIPPKLATCGGSTTPTGQKGAWEFKKIPLNFWLLEKKKKQ